MKESYSFSEEVVRTCSIKKLLIKFSQTSLWNLIKKETPIKIVSVNLVKFLKTPILQETCKWLVLDFAQFYMSHSIIHFISLDSKKGNYCVCVKRITLCNCLCSSSPSSLSPFSARAIRNIGEFVAKSYFTDHQRVNTIHCFTYSFPVLKICNHY